MEKKASNAQEVREELPREPPPSYSSICPPHGLDQLSTLSRVEVHQRKITTEQGDVIFRLNRQMDKGESKIFFDLLDTTGRMVIRFKTVDAWWTPRLEVHIDGQYVAKLGLNSIMNGSPYYLVSDAKGDKALKIKYTPGLYPSINQYWLRLNDLQGIQLGTITKKWIGVPKENFADTNELYIDFHRDLGVEYKASAIGLCIVLIYNNCGGFWPTMLTYLK